MYRALLIGLLSLLLMSCESLKPRTAPIEPPRIDCSSRAPAEAGPRAPRTTRWLDWAAWGRRWQGIATIEVNKRADVADCLDRERENGRIR